jgi:hypothetical protein
MAKGYRLTAINLLAFCPKASAPLMMGQLDFLPILGPFSLWHPFAKALADIHKQSLQRRTVASRFLLPYRYKIHTN